jgi:glycosyltransferase involved in cell wall biosynthesis
MILDGEYQQDPRVGNEARYLADQGHEVYVLCLNFDGRPAEEESDKVHVVRFPLRKKFKDVLFGMVNTVPIYDWIWMRAIRCFVERYGIEALHVHDLYMARAAHAANRNRGLPVTLDLHENYPAAVLGYTWANSFPRRLFARPGRWKAKEHRYLWYADRIVVLSDVFKDTLCESYPDLVAKRFAVYPNVPDVSFFCSLPVDAHVLGGDGGFVLFYFGVIGVRRGMVTCFEALKLLIHLIPNIKLLLIGPVDRADQPVFNRYVSDSVIGDHVIYYRWKDVSELPSYIMASDVCLAPFVNSAQHDSGIANKVFQYMLFERAVLLSNSKPHRLLVAETCCGRIFEDINAADMAAQIEWLYAHPAERVTMGLNGRKAVVEKYNLDVAGEALRELYAD